jgi:hypothetical protein
MKVTGKQKYFCIILALAMCILAEQSFAQQRRIPTVEEIITSMKQDLNLSDEQASRVAPIISNQLQQGQAIIMQAQETVRSKMQTLLQNTEAQLSKILTPEQMAKLKGEDQPAQKSSKPAQPNNANGNPIDRAVTGGR